MDDECIFKFRNSCPHNEKLQTSQSGGDRLQNIMDASRILGDNVLSELETKLVDDPLHQAQYHKKCVSLYLLNAKRTSDKEKRAGSESSPVPKKRTRSSVGPPFDWLHQCFYCSGQCMLEPDPKNPNRWNPAYLVRETEKKETGDEKTDPIEIRSRAKCHERADDWANDILDRLSGLTVRAADLHAADARYHRDCYARFFSGRSPSGETKTVVPPDLHLSAIETLASEIESDRSHMWDSVALMNRYLELGGKPLRRSMLIHLISEKVKDLVLLSAPGYRSILFFRDNTSATLKMIKDDGDDNLDGAITVVAKSIKKECSEIQYEHRTYTTKICKESAEEYVSDTIQQLLSKLSLDKQSLPSLLIGNMITSALKKHPTPLQIALGVYLHRRKIVMHMHDYLITCSYDELLRFKKSAAVAKYHDICSERRSPVKEDGLVQVVVDNFDAELSSPNGKISTHAMATIEAHSKPPAQPVPVTIPRISKTEMSSPISPEEEDELIAYIGTEKPSPPTLASHDLPSEYFEAQRVSYERAADMDFQFLKLIVSADDGKTPEWSGWSTCESRSQGHTPAPKTHIIYHPLLMAKPSDPSTVYTSMIKARAITSAAGQEYTLFTADQQLFKVAMHIIWDNPEQFSDFIPRLGGMHFLTNVIGCIGSLASDSGCTEVLSAAFAGVAKMLSGKRYPQNFRALVMLTEELLRPILTADTAAQPGDTSISSMDMLQQHLDTLYTQSRTSKFWINIVIRPTLLCMKFVRAEREGDYALYIKCVEECLPLFFAAKHHQYLRYGVVYLRMMEQLPKSVLDQFMKGHHTIHLRSGYWNGIWSDMGIETTWMRKGHGPEGVVGSTTKPESIKTWAYSYHDCLSLTSGLQEMRDPDITNVQVTHKEEAQARIKADGMDRQALRDKLAVCIDPLNTTDHPKDLVNIATGEVMTNETINVDGAVELGMKQQVEFETGWPGSFHAPVKATVVNWTANKKAINVNGQKIVDTGIFYARALALQASEREGVPTCCDMLATELAPVATSMFTDEGQMRTTPKSVLKKELAVERSIRGVEKSAVILDGCAVLWSVEFPSGNVTVQAYINAFRKHIRRYQDTSDVYLIFDRYKSGSTKEVTRWRREKGASRVFSLKSTSRLPAQSLLFSVTSNKVQIINMIIKDLDDHKDDRVSHSLIITGPEPVPIELPGPAGETDTGVRICRHDLVTTQEEADTIIVQQAAQHIAGNKDIAIVADDTDVFALLLHFRHCGSMNARHVYLESPLKGRATIDIDATVQENLSIIPGLLAAHALTGCDTVASHYGIGKGIVLKVLRAGGVKFDMFGNSSLPMEDYHRLLSEARDFILACYKMSDCDSLDSARVKMWQNKMRRNALDPPKLCSLPPTEIAFRENALRAHLAVVTWRDCLNTDAPVLDPTEHGWYHPEGSTMLLPTVVPPGTPLAPDDLLKVIKCGCCSDKPCATKRCSCKSSGLSCTSFCHCRGQGDSWNILR